MSHAVVRRSRRLTALYRWAVASRVAAAVAGGFAFTWLFTSALTRVLAAWLALPRVDAVLAATLASFLVYTVAAIAVFYARSAARAWVGLLVACIPPGIVVMLLWNQARP